MARLGWYLLFVISYLAYLVALGHAMQTMTRNPRAVLPAQLMLTASMAPLLLFPYLQSGFANLSFALFVVALFELSFVLAYICYWAFATSNVDAYLQGMWIGRQPSQRWRLSAFLVLWGIAGQLVYFVASSWLIWARPRHSPAAVSQAIILALAFSAYQNAGYFLSIIGLTSSPHLSDQVRRAELVRALVAGVVVAVLISSLLQFAAMDLQQPVRLFGVSLPRRYVTLGGIFSAYFVAAMAPYFVGVIRRKRYQIATYRRIVERLEQLTRVLEIPSASDVTQLESANADIAREQQQLWRTLRPEAEPAADPAAPPPVPSISALDDPMIRAVRDVDLRFVHLTYLQELSAKVAEIAGELKAAGAWERSIQLSKMYVDHFRQQREGLRQQISDLQTRRPVVAALRLLVAAAGLIPTVIEIGAALARTLSGD